MGRPILSALLSPATSDPLCICSVLLLPSPDFGGPACPEFLRPHLVKSDGRPGNHRARDAFSRSLLDRKLSKAPSRAGIAVFLLALAGGLCYIAFHVASDLDSVTITSIWPYMLLGLALLICAWLRVRQRLPRHRQTPWPRSSILTRSNRISPWFLSGILQPAWRTVLLRHGGLRGDTAAARGADHSGQLRRRLRDGLCVADRRHCVEPEHLVVRAAGLQLAHHGRLHYRPLASPNQLMQARTGTSGLDWEQAAKVLKALLISPVVGFVCAGLAALPFPSN